MFVSILQLRLNTDCEKPFAEVCETEVTVMFVRKESPFVQITVISLLFVRVFGQTN